jgi:hypothetical protein
MDDVRLENALHTLQFFANPLVCRVRYWKVMQAFENRRNIAHQAHLDALLCERLSQTKSFPLDAPMSSQRISGNQKNAHPKYLYPKFEIIRHPTQGSFAAPARCAARVNCRALLGLTRVLLEKFLA